MDALVGYYFILPLASGFLVIILSYLRHHSYYGYCDTGRLWDYILPRMVIPLILAVGQFLIGQPVVGGSQVTQVLAWIGATVTMTWMGEILIQNTLQRPPMFKQTPAERKEQLQAEGI